LILNLPLVEHRMDQHLLECLVHIYSRCEGKTPHRVASHLDILPVVLDWNLSSETSLASIIVENE